MRNCRRRRFYVDQFCFSCRNIRSCLFPHSCCGNKVWCLRKDNIGLLGPLFCFKIVWALHGWMTDHTVDTRLLCWRSDASWVFFVYFLPRADYFLDLFLRCLDSGRLRKVFGQGLLQVVELILNGAEHNFFFYLSRNLMERLVGEVCSFLFGNRLGFTFHRAKNGVLAETGLLWTHSWVSLVGRVLHSGSLHIRQVNFGT